MVTDLTNTPAWVREIADAVEDCPYPEAKRMPVAGFMNKTNGGACVSAADIPRLLEAAAGMAEVLEEQLRDDYTDCYGGVAMMAVDCVTCQLRDDCGRSRVLKALAKWRGEAGPTTRSEPYWWCPACELEVDATRVTCVCGHPVEWRWEADADA